MNTGGDIFVVGVHALFIVSSLGMLNYANGFGALFFVLIIVYSVVFIKIYLNLCKKERNKKVGVVKIDFNPEKKVKKK